MEGQSSSAPSLVLCSSRALSVDPSLLHRLGSPENRACSTVSPRPCNLRATGGCRAEHARSAGGSGLHNGWAKGMQQQQPPGVPLPPPLSLSRFRLLCRPALVPHPPCLRTGSCPSGHSEWPASRRACRAAARLLTGWRHMTPQKLRQEGRTDAQWQAAVATRRQMLNDLKKAHPGASGSQGGAGVCCRAASALSIRPAAACFPSPQAAV